MKRTNEDEVEVKSLQKEIFESKRLLREMEQELNAYRADTRPPDKSPLLENTRKQDSEQSIDYTGMWRLPEPVDPPEPESGNIIILKARQNQSKNCSLF